MKFLHLSDLHIGKVVNGFSMIEEQRHIFEQIYGYIDAEQPAAVLVTGDVYDRAVPGVEAVRVFDDFLTGLAAKNVAVLLIAGNHDSPERLNYASRLLAEHKLYFRCGFDGKLQPVTLTDERGDVDFWLLPFVKPSGVRGLYADMDVETYADAVSLALASADIDYSRRNVLLSHQFYVAAGVTPIRSESELNPVGGLDAVDAAILAKFDYAALGHLHGAQHVGKHIRYAGSPLKYSLSEWKQKKSVTLVTLGEKGDVTINELPLTPIHDMREIKGTLAALTGIDAAPDGREDYLRVILTDEEDIIDPIGKLRAVYPNVMALDFENTRTSVDIAPTDAGRVETLSAYELFSEFYLESNGAAMTEAQAAVARELLEGGAGE